MNYMLRILFIFIIFSITLNASLKFTKKEQTYINNNKVTVAILPDFPPFSTFENNKLSGYSYDILELISKKSGLKISYEVDSWPINLKKFKDKKIDIIDAISFRESRLEFTQYTKPYYEIPLVIFSRKDLNNYTNLESLKGKILGNTKNIFYKKQIEDLNIFKIKEYDSFKEKLQALAFGEVDVIFSHLLSTQIAISKSKYTNMKVLGDLNLPNLKKTDLRFGITKDNRILYSIFNKAFSSITKSEWNNLYKKWISIYTNNKKEFINLSKDEKDFILNKKFDCISTPNRSPFSFIENGENSGMSFDFWELIKEKTLIDSKCRMVDNFDKALNLIKDKKSDLIIYSSITDTKLNYAKFSLPYASYPFAVATTLDKHYFSNTSSLNGKKVAVGKSYSSHYILQEKYPDIKFIEYDNDIEALDALSKGDVYAVVDLLPVLSHIISSKGYKNLKISGTTDFHLDVRIMVRNDYKHLLSVINKGILSISNKESQEIKNRWLLVKFENIINYTKLWEFSLVALIILIILIYRQYILDKHNKKLKEANVEIESKTKELEEKSKELEKQKELFEKIYYESSDGVIILQLSNNKFIHCNEAAHKMLGYDTKEEFIKLDHSSLYPEFQPNGFESRTMFLEMIDIAIKKGSNTFEWVYLKKNGKTPWFEVVLTSIIIDNKSVVHIVCRDIYKRKKMEEELSLLTHNLEDKVKVEVKKNEENTKQLIQQNRLAQMGEMLSMIAHQWRQPLTAISATTNNLIIRLVLDKKIDNESLKKEISLISEYSQHLSMTIDDFRNFFKSNNNKMNTTLESIIENSINIVKNSLDSNSITLKTEFNCHKNINVFATELNQVILNIIKNSEDALVENCILNSEICIKTYHEDSYVIIEIKDNAKGIDESIIDKVFDPYYSTKKEKEGTGLGLYMSKIIVNDHCNGFLSVKNDNNGAIFKIKLPID